MTDRVEASRRRRRPRPCRWPGIRWRSTPRSPTRSPGPRARTTRESPEPPRASSSLPPREWLHTPDPPTLPQPASTPPTSVQNTSNTRPMYAALGRADGLEYGGGVPRGPRLDHRGHEQERHENQQDRPELRHCFPPVNGLRFRTLEPSRLRVPPPPNRGRIPQVSGQCRPASR